MKRRKRRRKKRRSKMMKRRRKKMKKRRRRQDGAKQTELIFSFRLCVSMKNKEPGDDKRGRLNSKQSKGNKMYVTLWECCFLLLLLLSHFFLCVSEKKRRERVSRARRPFPKGNICTFQTNCVRKMEAKEK